MEIRIITFHFFEGVRLLLIGGIGVGLCEFFKVILFKIILEESVQQGFLVILKVIHIIDEELQVVLEVFVFALDEDMEENIGFFLEIKRDLLAIDFREIKEFQRLLLESRWAEGFVVDVGFVAKTVENDYFLNEF